MTSQVNGCMCDFHMRFRRFFWHKIVGHKNIVWIHDDLHGYCNCGEWFAKTINGKVAIGTHPSRSNK